MGVNKDKRTLQLELSVLTTLTYMQAGGPSPLLKGTGVHMVLQ